MYITIDPYYGNEFYNECLEALKNNEIKFEEYISTIPPYNWYIKIDKTPVMVNYDTMKNQERRYLVNKIQALRPNEEYVLRRRNDDVGLKNLQKYVENEPFSKVKEYGIVFSVRNKQEIIDISKEYPNKIWYLGKYWNSKYQICLASNSIIKNFLDQGQILLENDGKFKQTGQFESMINYKVLQNKDMIEKYIETPYFKKGKYYSPKLVPEDTDRFIPR